MPVQNVSAHDAKARFGQLLDTARREPVVIERHGRAVAVVLSKEEYDDLNAIKMAHLRAEIDQGLADLERGAFTDYEADDLPELGERIKAAGRKVLADK
jgi:prevent-host-death family protein